MTVLTDHRLTVRVTMISTFDDHDTSDEFFDAARLPDVNDRRLEDTDRSAWMRLLERHGLDPDTPVREVKDVSYCISQAFDAANMEGDFDPDYGGYSWEECYEPEAWFLD